MKQIEWGRVEGLVVSSPICRERTVLSQNGVDNVGDNVKVVNSHCYQRQCFLLRVSKLEAQSQQWEVTGLIQVYVEGNNLRLEYGDHIQVQGYFREPSLPANPGAIDYRQYLERKGVYLLLSCKRKGGISVFANATRISLVKIATVVRNKLVTSIYTVLPLSSAGLLEGLLLGNRQAVPVEYERIFMRGGILHILAVSGLHVGLISFSFYSVFRVLRLPRRLNAISTVLIILFYTLVTGARVPVVRAAIMAIYILIGIIIEREIDFLHTIALAALLILIFHPLTLFDPGFQLSFVAVLSIGCFFPLLEKKLSSLPLLFRRLIGTITAAQLGVIPLTAYYFHIITPVAFLTNLVVLPALGVIIATGFLAVLIGLVNSSLAFIPAKIETFLLTGLVGIVDIIARLPGAHIYTGSPPLPSIFLYFFFLGIVVYAWNHIN